MISPGVLPIISLASAPTAKILLSICEMATTDGSLSTTPRPGTKTSVFAVPRSIPSLGEKNDMLQHNTPPDSAKQTPSSFRKRVCQESSCSSMYRRILKPGGTPTASSRTRCVFDFKIPSYTASTLQG